MSIGSRFVNLVRSNLTSLLDKAREDGVRIEKLSDAELEKEMLRRRARREAAARGAANASVEDEAWAEAERAAEAGTGRFRTAGSGGRSYRTSYRGGATAGGRDPRLAKLYAQLECPYGADATTVRKHYRKMMRKYHPDMHSGDTGKERIATELSQRLTMAYNELKRVLK